MAILPVLPATAEEHEGEETVKRTELVYEKLYGLTVNLFSQNRVEGQLLVSIDLEAKAVNGDQIRYMKPRLTDAYNRRLLRFGQTILDTKRPLDIERMEYALQRTTDEVLGKGMAKVLLYSALVSEN